MSLREQTWKKVSMHEVVLAWIRAERNKNDAKQTWPVDADLTVLLDNADLRDAAQNRRRLQLLYLIRSKFFLEIPPDTDWYKCILVRYDFSNLHVIKHPNWDNLGDELLKVAASKPLKLISPPSRWDHPVFWGHDRNGPFTILEGNHRLTAYAGTGESDLNITALVGLSP